MKYLIAVDALARARSKCTTSREGSCAATSASAGDLSGAAGTLSRKGSKPGGDSLDASGELGLLLSIQCLSARELTVFACASAAADRAASSSGLWRELWRRRYGGILQSVPESLRSVDSLSPDSNPLIVLRDALDELPTPPRWWIETPQPSYGEHLARLERHFGERRWKLFYFAFGLHWTKWAVAEHASSDDCWLVIHGIVFDMSQFFDHPGGMEPFMRFAGMDATEAFEAMGHSWVGKRGMGEELQVPELRLPEEGGILRPIWLSQQEPMPAWKRWLSETLLLDLNRKLSYHDFW